MVRIAAAAVCGEAERDGERPVRQGLSSVILGITAERSLSISIRDSVRRMREGAATTTDSRSRRAQGAKNCHSVSLVSSGLPAQARPASEGPTVCVTGDVRRE